jgi:hypothetical protein
MMTVVNKFVVSGSQFTMTFLRECGGAKQGCGEVSAEHRSIDLPIGRVYRVCGDREKGWLDKL